MDGHGIEQFEGLRYAHVQHVCDGLAFVLDLQGFIVETLSLALIAHDVHIREEVHGDLDETVALACLAPAALDVEAEPAGLVPPQLGVGQHGEDLADEREDAGVGGRVRPGRPSDGALVHIDYPVDELDPGNGFHVVGHCTGAGKRLGEIGIECIDDEARLAGAGNAGDAGEQADGYG